MQTPSIIHYFLQYISCLCWIPLGDVTVLLADDPLTYAPADKAVELKVYQLLNIVNSLPELIGLFQLLFRLYCLHI